MQLPAPRRELERQVRYGFGSSGSQGLEIAVSALKSKVLQFTVSGRRVL